MVTLFRRWIVYPNSWYNHLSSKLQYRYTEDEKNYMNYETLLKNDISEKYNHESYDNKKTFYLCEVWHIILNDVSKKHIQHATS